MKKSKRKPELVFRVIRSPYKIESSEHSINDLYQKYLQDKEATIEINGLTYYRIIDLYEFRIRNASTIAVLDNKMNLKIGDVLTDENGQIYNIISFEMFRISSAVFPEWYLKISFVVLDGDPYKIGNYLAKVQK